MLTELQEKWLQALESGEYQQGQINLRSVDNKFCCLGVGCEVIGLTARLTHDDYLYDDKVSVAPQALIKALNLHDEYGRIPGAKISHEHSSLTKMNDNGMSFKDIAAFIRANPELVFKQE